MKAPANFIIGHHQKLVAHVPLKHALCGQGGIDDPAKQTHAMLFSNGIANGGRLCSIDGQIQMQHIALRFGCAIRVTFSSAPIAWMKRLPYFAPGMCTFLLFVGPTMMPVPSCSSAVEMHAEAFAEWEKGIAAVPKCDLTYVHMARALIERKRLPEAKLKLEALLKVSPESDGAEIAKELLAEMGKTT